LNRVLAKALTRHEPHAVLGRRIKLRYANQTGRNPPVILVHGNQTEQIKESYRAFLINQFREAFNLRGVPLRIEFRTGDNPFKGRKNELSGRQIKKRKRLMDRKR
jgi:GTP-binding protein